PPSLHDALPIWATDPWAARGPRPRARATIGRCRPASVRTTGAAAAARIAAARVVWRSRSRCCCSVCAVAARDEARSRAPKIIDRSPGDARRAYARLPDTPPFGVVVQLAEDSLPLPLRGRIHRGHVLGG